jgi:hypothetical protein
LLSVDSLTHLFYFDLSINISHFLESKTTKQKATRIPYFGKEEERRKVTRIYEKHTVYGI